MFRHLSIVWVYGLVLGGVNADYGKNAFAPRRYANRYCTVNELSTNFYGPKPMAGLNSANLILFTSDL